MRNDSEVMVVCAEARDLRWQSRLLGQQSVIAAAQLRQRLAERRTLVVEMAATRKALQELLQEAPRRTSGPLRPRG